MTFVAIAKCRLLQFLLVLVDSIPELSESPPELSSAVLFEATAESAFFTEEPS